MIERPRQAVVGKLTITLLKVADGWEVSALNNERTRPRRQLSTIYRSYDRAHHHWHGIVTERRREYNRQRAIYRAQESPRKHRKRQSTDG